jgi:hypothetical protein
LPQALTRGAMLGGLLLLCVTIGWLGAHHARVLIRRCGGNERLSQDDGEPECVVGDESDDRVDGSLVG